MKRAETLCQSFRFAGQGLWYALVTQRNMRIHVFLAFFIMAAGWFLYLPLLEFVPLITAIVVVIVAEMINTAIEATVDLASPSFHPLAQTAKDVAAGAVLLAAMGAVALGVWAFAGSIFHLPHQIVLRFSHQ
ncbi:MAG: diacylglycerol kinase family protein, partial [Firmicutes bacterium]|nr:diacylglycerol kinase family protein [Bacillota bacterium]